MWPLELIHFTADGTAPIVTSNLESGVYNSTQLVTLNATG